MTKPVPSHEPMVQPPTIDAMAFAERCHDMVQLVSSDGSLRYVNPAWQRVLGYTSEEALQLSLPDVLAPESLEHCLALLPRLLAGEDVGVIAASFRAKEGRTILMEGYSFLQPARGDEEELATAGVFRDVTARTDEQAALRIREERWALALEGALDGMWDWNVTTGEVYFSPAWERMFGYAPGTAPRELDAFASLVHPDDVDSMFAEIHRYLQREIPAYSREFRMRRLDGTDMWTLHRAIARFDETGRAVRMVGTTADTTARREAEEKLRESNERFRAVAAMSPDWVWTIDAKGRHTYSNAAVLPMLGYRADEIVGEPRDVLYHPDELELIASLTASLRAQHVSKATLSDSFPETSATPSIAPPIRYRHRDGTYRYGACTLTPMLDQHGALEGWHGITRDVTAQIEDRRTEREHTRSLLGTAMESVADGLAILDRDEIVVETNQRFRDVLRLPEETSSGVPFRRVFDIVQAAAVDPDSFVRTLESVHAQPLDPTFQRIALKDGRILEWYCHPHLLNNDVVGRVISVRDVTSRENAARRLEMQSHLLGEAQRVGRIGSFDWVPSRSAPSELSWSTEMYRLHGVDPESFVPTRQSYIALLEGKERTLLNQALQSMNEGRTPPSLEYTIPDASGGVRVLRMAGEITRNGDEAIVIGTVQDLTELREAEVRLQLAQKMEALGRLAGGIAHDYNNVLMVVSGHAEQLADGRELTDPVAKKAQIIMDAARRATQLTSQLLALGRRQVLQPTSVDLNQVVLALKNMASPVLGAGLELVLSLAPTLDPVWMDPGQLDQVILNLLVNARDAMDGRGQVSISTSTIEVGNRHPLRQHVAAAPYVVLTVRDSGVGMDEATCDRIFEPFFTTKDADRGTGLGLAMVYGIVAQSGAHIDVSSEPGQGTMLAVELRREAWVFDPDRLMASPRGCLPRMVG